MPNTVAFHDWRFVADAIQTGLAYQGAIERGAAECDCAWCRNFVKQRSREYPSALVEFLNSVGIDPFKEAEVWQVGPLIDGRAYNSGWWQFVGQVSTIGSSPVSLAENPRCASVDWKISFREGDKSLKLSTLPESPLVLVEFSAMMPWILDEPYPE